MGIFENLEDFLTGQSANIPALGFLINLLLSAICAHLLGRLYVHCGESLSNRRNFARNFVQLTVTTMLVITVVKASLALSLGLVGALSIVRFRAAIKEPEELSYLFLAIALGLGFGANQWRITLIAFAAISMILLIKQRFKQREEQPNLFLTVSSRNPNKIGLDALLKVLTDHCAAAAMTRFDETADALEATFQVEFDGFHQLHAAKLALQGLSDSLTISFVDSKGVS